ncbi:MAG: MFS transporter [Chloroflexi bacterium]|nr:MFS transporter [Chloroflexota bacterium]
MKKWGTLITMALAMFIIVIDTTIMNVSISALVVDLNTTVVGVQSAISIYAMVMASLMLIGSRLSDILGTKKIFVIGLIIYSIGTTLASLAPSLSVMIVGWSVMEGVGAALMIPTIQVLLRKRYEGEDLAFAYGIVAAVAAVGAAVGPIVGGFFTTYISWRWAFRTELVIAILVLLLSRTLMADKRSETRPKFDYLGSLLSILGWSSIVLGILQAQEYGFFLAKKPFMIGDLAFAPFGLSISPVMVGFGVIMIMLLFAWEERLEASGGDGLFRPSIFQTPGLKSSMAVRFVQMAIMAGFLYIFPLMLQLSFSYTAMQTGLALMPFSLSLLIMAILGAKLSAKFFANRIIVAGFVLATAGLGVIGASIKPDIRATDLAVGALFGLGLGLINSQILNFILSSVKPEQTAEASGVNSTFEQLGNAIGVALIGTILLAALTASAGEGIQASAIIPQEAKAEMAAAVEDGVQLVSNEVIESGLDESGVDANIRQEVLRIYNLARTQAFKAGVSLLAFFSLIALILAFRLPKRKLVSA